MGSTNANLPKRIQIVDSHTGGEPTRVVIDSGLVSPAPGAVATREFLAAEADWLRSAMILEPRGFEAMVGAFLCEPADPTCAAGVVFFNNVSYLNGCLHGTIGLVATLVHLGRLDPGSHRIETPSGIVTASVTAECKITVKNVPSYVFARRRSVEVPNFGTVTGDIAWGGNWFFLINDQGPPVRFDQIEALTGFTSSVQQALMEQGIRGANNGLIDHIECFGPPAEGVDAQSQNFVLCPGGAYDRSPCGTGTSAKLACLADSGELAEGDIWRQASIIGTIFEGQYERIPDIDHITPMISGSAHITAESTIILDARDPFQFGIHS